MTATMSGGRARSASSGTSMAGPPAVASAAAADVAGRSAPSACVVAPDARASPYRPGHRSRAPTRPRPGRSGRRTRCRAPWRRRPGSRDEIPMRRTVACQKAKATATLTQVWPRAASTTASGRALGLPGAPVLVVRVAGLGAFGIERHLDVRLDRHGRDGQIADAAPDEGARPAKARSGGVPPGPVMVGGL